MLTQGPVLPETIESLCEIMTDTTIGDAIERYSEVNRRFLTFSNQSSMDVSYDSYISAMQNTSWDGPASDGGVCVCVCVCVYVCVCVVFVNDYTFCVCFVC